MLSQTTIERRLSDTCWITAGQVCEDLRQCGPLAFESDEEYRTFRFSVKRKQYQVVYGVLMILARRECIDSALGDNRGREVRVFKLLGAHDETEIRPEEADHGGTQPPGRTGR